MTRTPSPQDQPERTNIEAADEKEHSPPPTEAKAPAEDEHLEASTEEKPATPKASPKPSPRPRPPKTDPSKEDDTCTSAEAEPDKLSATSPDESPSTPELPASTSSDPDTAGSSDDKPNEDDKPVIKETSPEPDKTEDTPADSSLPQEPAVPTEAETTESQEQNLQPSSTDSNTPTLPEKLDSPPIGEMSATPPVEETPTIPFPKEEPKNTETDKHKQPSNPLPVTESTSKLQSLSVRYVCSVCSWCKCKTICPCTCNYSEDDHKQVNQLPPSEPKIILPMSPIVSTPIRCTQLMSVRLTLHSRRTLDLR